MPFYMKSFESTHPVTRGTQMSPTSHFHRKRGTRRFVKFPLNFKMVPKGGLELPWISPRLPCFDAYIPVHSLRSPGSFGFGGMKIASPMIYPTNGPPM